MTVINQNTAILSLDQALVPSPLLVDGRTELDWLNFLSDFATLINFYDSNNNINGNWAPFLLKDPVILLASISKTNVAKMHSLFMQTCMKLEQAFQTDNNAVTHLSNSFNQLFDQLIRIFMHLERWIHFMHRSDQEYSLKKYVIHQVKTIFSPLLWAILMLREELFLFNIIPGLHPVHAYLFESYDEKIWKQNKDKRPFWEILGLNSILAENQVSAFFYALKKAGDQLFLFFNNIVQHAGTAFEKLKLETGKFPDTILVRTFVNLLTLYRDQLNGISQKHLDFYYNDILKQELRPAIPDTVFICAELAKKDTAFYLPAGTLFDGGLDLQNDPIVFASQKSTSLNPASIIGAVTLNVLPDNTYPASLYLQPTPVPGAIQKDADGNVQSWPLFGNDTPPLTAKATLGFVVASPMLLLREGTRSVVLNLIFNAGADLSILNTATYFLSTQSDWLKIGVISPVLTTNTTVSTQAQISFTLAATQPPIEAFLVNPDGYTSDWPLLKIEFDSFADAIQAPVLNSLSIQVTVSNVKTLQLYNDFGLLSTKAPFQLFGPIPLINSNFIIGSNEIFSKPVYSFYIDMKWDKLPTNFQTYYQQYNNYLAPTLLVEAELQKLLKTTPAVPAATAPPAGIIKKAGYYIKKAAGGIWDFFKKIITGIVKFFVGIITKIITLIGGVIKKVVLWVAGIIKKIEDALIANSHLPFNNVCFTVDFNVLENNSWNPLQMKKQQVIIVTDANAINGIPYSNDSKCVPEATSNDNLLFSTDGTCTLTDSSYFAYDTNPAPQPTPSTPLPVIIPSGPEPIINSAPVMFPVDPALQLTPLKYTDTSSAGFIKMVLTGPVLNGISYGFGSEVYPKVVSDIALKNALGIAKTPPIDASQLIPPANLPFAPKLAGFTAHYSASQTYDLSKKGDYPIRCYAYSPFAKYLIYDNTQDTPVFNYSVGDSYIQQGQSPYPAAQNNTTSAASPAAAPVVQKSTGFPLFPSLNGYKGLLFLQVANIVAPNEISFFFELARKYGDTSASALTVDYYYLSINGWQQLSVLSDGTNNLSCSGIIKLNVPGDITNTVAFMPGPNYWITIAVKGAPDAFAKVIFLKTNGIELIRSGNDYLTDTVAPVLLSSTISKPKTAIPQIAAIVQPFQSFGGKPMENQLVKNYRVSNRLKTKGRAVSPEDYYRMIHQEFDDIYYSKTSFDKKTKITQVYVVKQYQSITDANAFTPLVSDCEEQKIQHYLQKRAAVFSNIQVSNFDFQYVTITVNATIKDAYEIQGMSKNIMKALNLFLSPWITSDEQQTTIDEPISDFQVAALLSGMEGIENVAGVAFETWITDRATGNKITGTDQQQITQLTTAALIVSGMNHLIQLSYLQ